MPFANYRIVTECCPKPGPGRSNDWTAVDDDTYAGYGSLIGSGTTGAEGVVDLRQQIEEEAG